MLGVGGRRDRHVEPQHVGLSRPVEVLEAGDDAGRDPGHQDRHQVGAVGRVRGEIGEHAGVEHGQQLRQLRLGDVLGELRVVARLGAVPPVLRRRSG